MQCFKNSKDIDIPERSQLCAEINRLNQELWGRKCCVDRQDAELRACRQRIGELEDGNFLQEQLNLSNAKLKSSEHARRTAESKIVEQSNMLEAIVQMQSTIELLTKAAQQQTQDQRQQHQAVLQAQQQQMDALKLAFHKQAQELSALQSALSMVPASRSRGLQSYPSDSPEYMTQGDHAFRSCRSTAETEAAEVELRSHSDSMHGDKPAAHHLGSLDLLSKLNNKQAMATLQGDQCIKQEQLIGAQL